jgi:nicotinic acid mononucleotide adenylyltransferase
MKKYSLVAYGGAFNPPHLDHTGPDGIIGRLLDTLTERVHIIPTGKRDDKDYHGVSDADRLEMLRFSTAEYGDRVEIDDVLLR